LLQEILIDAVVHAVNKDYPGMAGDFIKLGFLAQGELLLSSPSPNRGFSALLQRLELSGCRVCYARLRGFEGWADWLAACLPGLVALC
jgi:hypothetical protein